MNVEPKRIVSGLFWSKEFSCLQQHLGHLSSITPRFYIEILNTFVIKNDPTWRIQMKIFKLPCMVQRITMSPLNMCYEIVCLFFSCSCRHFHEGLVFGTSRQNSYVDYLLHFHNNNNNNNNNIYYLYCAFSIKIITSVFKPKHDSLWFRV